MQRLYQLHQRVALSQRKNWGNVIPGIVLRVGVDSMG